MTELLQALTDMIDMTIDENTSCELRNRIDKAIENHHQLNAAVIRIETKFTAAEARLSGKISEITDVLKSIALVSQDMQEIRMKQNSAIEEHLYFRKEEDKHKTAIDGIERRLEKYELIIKIMATIIGFLTAVAVPVVASMAKRVFNLPL